MEKRIHNISDVEYYYNREQIAYCASEDLYYDPKCNTYHVPNGEIFDPDSSLVEDWFEDMKFKYEDGSPCYLPEQDPSWGKTFSSKKDPRWTEPGPRDRQITNFLVLGTMSGCSKTTFNAGQHPTTSWEKQKPCSFAVQSIIENRCMYWDRNLEGHCDCHLAYQHKTGSKVDLTRTINLRKEDEIKDIPSDYHFKEALEVGLETLQRWFNDEDRLQIFKEATASEASIFYDAEWDVYFDGRGKFLEKMTRRRREINENARDFAYRWAGPIQMQNHDPPTMVSVGVDNSGIIDPLKMHEMLHEIAKCKNADIKEITWHFDTKDPCFHCVVDPCDHKCLGKIAYEKGTF